MNQSSSPARIKVLPYSLLVVACSMVIVTSVYSFILNASFFKIIRQFFAEGYLLHYNFVVAPSVGKLNFHFYMYIVFVLCLVLHTCILFFYRMMFPEKNRLNLPFARLTMSCILFVLVTANQYYTLMRYFKAEQKLYGGKSLHGRNLNLLDGLTYKYATICKHVISGHRNAQLITDFELTKEPGMTHHRMLGYYLYPIDIRNVRQQEPDYLLYFMKNNAKKEVPENFKIIATINEANLIAERIK